jgi:NADPH:quinone reductase-like Zn-dependent oxidoreductase
LEGGGAGKKSEGMKGLRVLVNGASGGVGTVLVQICKGMGAEVVVGVCSGASEGLVKGLGVDEVSL